VLRATLVIQTYARGWLARQQLFWKRVAAQIADEERRRTWAAVHVQAYWRGAAARRQFAPVWAAHQHQKQLLQAALVLQRVC
jgi:hypothetical protein